MLWIHVAAGTLAIVAGALALTAGKGGPLHRRSGLAFVVAMLTMTASAVVIAAFLRPNPGNVVAGTLTFYLVSTGLLAVRRESAGARALLVGLMLVAAVVGSAALALAFAAQARPNGAIDGIPAVAFHMFATVGLLAAAFDARLLWRGGLDARGRIARHLGRMGYAMWIATMSLFLGQAQLFPAALRESGLLFVPVLLVTGALLFWMVRIRFGRLPVRHAARRSDALRAAAA